jgi:GAF domain-containing protein
MKRGVAAKMIRATLTIGLATVMASGAVALVSTYRLASEKADSADLRVLQSADAQIESAFGSAIVQLEEVASTAASGALTTADLERAVRESRTLDYLILADGDGTVAMSYPATTTTDVARILAFGSSRSGTSAFIRDARSGSWWAGRALATPEGRSGVVLGRIDAGFVRELVEGLSKESPGTSIFVFEDGDLVGAAGPHRDRTGEAAVAEMDDESARARVVLPDGDTLEGHFEDVYGSGGINWRVLAVETRERVIADVLTAVMPFLLVLLVGGVTAVVTAWLVSRQVTRPLHELERVARTAASGAFVKTIPVSDDDEIGRVAEAFNAVALRLNSLNDLSQLMATASRLDQALDATLSAMGHIVGPGASAVFLLDRHGAVLEVARTRGLEFTRVRPILVDGGGWIAEALGHSVAQVHHGLPDAVAEQIPGLIGRHNGVLCSPLIVGHEALGVVAVLLDPGAELSAAQLEMARTFSSQAAIAVNTSRLFIEESDSRRMAEALRSVAEVLSRPEGLLAALDSAERVIAGAYGARDARVVFDDPAALGLAESDPRRGADLYRRAYAMLADHTRATVVSCLEDDSRARAALFDDPCSVLTPIAAESGHGAILVIGFDGEGAAQEALESSRAFADEIALALENAYLYERALSRAENLENIFRISQAVGSSLQVNIVLNRVLDVVQKILQADAAVLWAFDRKRRSLGTAMLRGTAPREALTMEITPGEDLPGRVFSSRRLVSLGELDEEMDGFAGAAAGEGLRSLIAVPLLARGRAMGVLAVLASKPRAFTEEDSNLLQTFGMQAALAIDTAATYSREHEVASILQSSVVPDALVSIDGIDAGSVYEPAGPDVEIGGDYYDMFRSDDGAVWFAMADVCGKGVQAATKTSMIKYTVRALVAAGQNPDQIMSEVNRIVTDAGDPSDIVTLWLGRYNREESMLEWANGGHPPSLLVRKDGRCDRLGPTGPLLGALREAPYTLGKTSFGIGDRIVLYTDGVTEARLGNTFFGEERVLGFLEVSSTPMEFAQGLLDAVRAFVRDDLRDDVAILVIDSVDANKTRGDEETGA